MRPLYLTDLVPYQGEQIALKKALTIISQDIRDDLIKLDVKRDIQHIFKYVHATINMVEHHNDFLESPQDYINLDTFCR